MSSSNVCKSLFILLFVLSALAAGDSNLLQNPAGCRGGNRYAQAIEDNVSIHQMES